MQLHLQNNEEVAIYLYNRLSSWGPIGTQHSILSKSQKNPHHLSTSPIPIPASPPTSHSLVRFPFFPFILLDYCSSFALVVFPSHSCFFLKVSIQRCCNFFLPIILIWHRISFVKVGQKIETNIFKKQSKCIKYQKSFMALDYLLGLISLLFWIYVRSSLFGKVQKSRSQDGLPLATQVVK